MRALRCGALGLGLVIALGASAQANVVQVFSRAAVGNTTFSFGSFGPAGTVLSTPVFEPGGPGTVGVSSSSGTLYIKQQGTDWNGNFAPGDFLLAQQDDDRSDTFIVSFAGKPVLGVGTQIQPASGFYGTFTGNMELFGAGAVLLGTVSVTGDSTSAGDNSAPFIGAISNVPIAFIEFDVATGFPNFPVEGDLAINDLTLRVVPEPATLAILGPTLLGLAALRRRRRV